MFPFAKKAVSNLFKKPSTVRFPEVESPAKPAYRGRIVYDAEKCVNCGMCIKVCSPGAITRTVEEVEGGEKITYDINLTSCTFCGTCQDFCGTKAISLSDDYHMVAEDPKDLIVSGSRIKEKVAGRVTLKQEDCVYCGLCARTCPENAITVDRATKTWKINYEECVQCGQCISKCPKKALSFQEPKAQGVINGGDCVFCTLCSKKCPVGALTVDRAAKTWEIDRSVCIKCGLCVSSCPKHTLVMGDVDDNTPARFEKSAAPVKSAPAPAAPAKEAPAAPAKEAPASGNAPKTPENAPKTVPAAPVADSPAKAQKSAVSAEKAAAAAPVLSGLIPQAQNSWDTGVVLGPDCIYCGLCMRKCPMEAITVDRASKSWQIDREKCVWCGICVSGCPKKTLKIDARSAETAKEAAAHEAPAPEKNAEAASEAKAAHAAAATGVVFGEGCIYCGACSGACPVGAISVDGSEWSIDRDACIQCGACVGTCPMGVLSIGPLE